MKIADQKTPSDWELFFKHRRNPYIPLEVCESRFQVSIDFTILITPADISKIDGTKDIIILNIKEQFAVTNNIDDLKRQCRRPIEEVLILGDVVFPNSFLDFSNPNYVFAGSWFESPVGVISQTVESKKYLFDFMVGYQRKECDYLFDSFDQKGLINDTALYKYADRSNFDFNHLGELFEIGWEGNMEKSIDLDIWASEFGTSSVNIHSAWASRIVPQRAYEQSLFSVVRESQFYNWNELYYQPSEKTAKPILCKRMFFVLGAQGWHDNYKNLGFVPYDYANNTWDHLPNWRDRTDRFAEYIATLDQDRILSLYQQEKNNIEHNYNIATQSWGQKCLNFVMQKLK